MSLESTIIGNIYKKLGGRQNNTCRMISIFEKKNHFPQKKKWKCSECPQNDIEVLRGKCINTAYPCGANLRTLLSTISRFQGVQNIHSPIAFVEKPQGEWFNCQEYPYIYVPLTLAAWIFFYFALMWAIHKIFENFHFPFATFKFQAFFETSLYVMNKTPFWTRRTWCINEASVCYGDRTKRDLVYWTWWMWS